MDEVQYPADDVTVDECFYSEKYHCYLRRIPTSDERKSSLAWNSFDVFLCVDENGTVLTRNGSPMKVVRCRHPSCGNAELLFLKGGTSGMLSHYQSKHAASENSLTATERKKKRVVAEAEKEQVIADVIQEDTCGSSRGFFSGIDDKLLSFFVECGIPFAVANHDAFIRFCESLNRCYKVPDRRHLSGVLLPKKVDEMEKRCRLFFLKSLNKVFISVHKWIEPKKSGSFLAIKAHGLNGDFENCEVTLDLIPLDKSQQTAESISFVISCVLSDWQIGYDKVEAVITDGSNDMLKAVRDLGFSGIVSLAHRIHLIVMQLIQRSKMSDVILKVSRNIGIIRRSLTLCAKLNEIQDAMQMKTNRLVKAVSTRWDSVLHMLRSVYSNIEVINQLVPFQVEEKLSGQKLSAFSDKEKEQIFALIEALTPFEQVTKIVSDLQSSLCVYIVVVRALKECLVKKGRNPETSQLVARLATMATELLDDRFFNNNKNDINSNLCLLRALYFHPSFSGTSFLSTAKWIQISCDIEGRLAALASREGSSETLPLLEESSCSESFPGTESTENENLFSFLNQLSEQYAMNCVGIQDAADMVHSTVKNEMQRYWAVLNNNRKKWGSTKPLDFWRSHRDKLPLLATLARDTIAGPLGSAGVERLFSIVGRIMDDQCQDCLQSISVNKLLKLREYFYKGKGYFEPTSTSDYCDGEDELDDSLEDSLNFDSFASEDFV